MSEKYLPLFRKYRPQSFRDVVGQESLTRALSNAIELGRIANAYLFAGPRGTGKTSCARIFAKSLNCIEGPTLIPCQKCPSCLDITNASGLDVIEIDAATNRGIDDAKELIAQTQYAPMNGKYKIFIIDEVHMLSNEAFNALLKTFEEPPANVIFILATTEPHKVIETIVSRCQRFDLRRITTDDIVRRLREISDIEKIKITDDALSTIAKNVSGGLRDSLALLDQVSILGAREEITKETIENLLGKVTFDVAFDFLNKILAKNIENALFSLDEIYNKGLEPKNFCENLIEFLRNLIFALKSADEAGILKFTNFNALDIERIRSANFDAAKIFRVLEKVIEYYKEIRFTANPYLWAELMVISICKDETPAVQAVSASLNTASSAAASVIETAKSLIKPAVPVKSTPVAEEKIAEVKSQNATQSVVKETLKELNIPEKDLVKESPDDGVQNLGEYKEALYNKPESSLSASTAYKASAKAPEVSAEPAIPDVLTSDVVSNAGVAGKITPISAWSNVLNAIESVPAKFFYSGVGKLIDIQNKRITLGFVNENAISQAKSDLKHKHLIKAIQNTLGEDYSAEFILITENTKVLDVKAAPKVQENRKPKYAKNPVFEAKTEIETQDLIGESSGVQNAAKAGGAPVMPEVPTDESTGEDNKDSNSKAKTLSSYGQKTREMLEAFNGKVID